MQTVNSPFKTGGLVLPMRVSAGHPQFPIAGTPPTYASIPLNVQPPVLYQQHQDCGPCSWSYMFYLCTGHTVSPRLLYYLSRKMAGTFPADTGTYAIYNAKVSGVQGDCDELAWPYAGDINEVPSSASMTAALLNRVTYYQSSTIPQIKAAIASGLYVNCHFYLTDDWWYPTRLADGSYEVKTPSAASKPVGGHFAVLDAYDGTRVMLDGTVGGYRVFNQWGGVWGNGGRAWISEAAWIAQRGDPNSRYVMNSKEHPPVPTTSVPATGATFSAGTYSAISNCHTETQPNGMIDVGYVNGAAYVEYTLAVDVAATYAMTVKLAAPNVGQTIVAVNGTSLPALTVPNTTAWNVFQPVTMQLALPAGTVTIRFSNVNSCQYNLGDISLTPAAPVGPALSHTIQVFVDGSIKLL